MQQAGVSRVGRWERPLKPTLNSHRRFESCHPHQNEKTEVEMFYCNDCANKHQWPETGFKSYGKCEMCDQVAGCNDMPSYLLPPARYEERRLEDE